MYILSAVENLSSEKGSTPTLPAPDLEEAYTTRCFTHGSGVHVLKIKTSFDILVEVLHSLSLFQILFFNLPFPPDNQDETDDCDDSVCSLLNDVR